MRACILVLLVALPSASRLGLSLADKIEKYGAWLFPGFGGVLPFARSTIVEDRGWMTPHEFNETLALCQFLPGPASSQTGITLGILRAGLPGAFAAWIGFSGRPSWP